MYAQALKAVGFSQSAAHPGFAVKYSPLGLAPQAKWPKYALNGSILLTLAYCVPWKAFQYHNSNQIAAQSNILSPYQVAVNNSINYHKNIITPAGFPDMEHANKLARERSERVDKDLYLTKDFIKRHQQNPALFQ